MYLAKNLTHSFDKAKQEDLLDTCIITGTMLLKVTVFLVLQSQCSARSRAVLFSLINVDTASLQHCQTALLHHHS